MTISTVYIIHAEEVLSDDEGVITLPETTVIFEDNLVRISQGDSIAIPRIPLSRLLDLHNVRAQEPLAKPTEDFYRTICRRLEERTSWGRNQLLEVLEEEYYK